MSENTDENRRSADENTSDLYDVGLAAAFGGARKLTPAASVLPAPHDRGGSVSGAERIGPTTTDPPVDVTEEGAQLRDAGGRYELLGEIGRGGMGIIYRGRDRDLGRNVAMKVLKDEYAQRPEVLSRFVEEAQIGGQLQHPGIVPVYELGLRDGDRPYFAMKLVEGETLAEQLARRSDSTEGRSRFLSVFEQVCQTVAYAHSRGVVHRDLKPANVMIGAFGEVQVVDWGFAKVLAPGAKDEARAALPREESAEHCTIETARSSSSLGAGSTSVAGSMLGTPAYMSPEQAQGDIQHLDEHADVFGLGAILCEILTGAPPYRKQDGDVIRQAEEAMLEPARQRLTECGADEALVALCLQCLAPVSSARPASAKEPAERIRTYLTSVEARVQKARVEAAESRGRAASLKRMHRLGVTLTGAIVAGLLVSLWSWRAAYRSAESEILASAAASASALDARENELLTVAGTERAEQELSRAIAIKRLINEMLKSMDPSYTLGANAAPMKVFLDSASTRLIDRTAEDELVAAELHEVLGNLYRHLGLFAEAELHLPLALELRTRLQGEGHPSTSWARYLLGALRLSEGRLEEADKICAELMEAMQRLPDVDHSMQLQAKSLKADVSFALGRDAESEALYAEILRDAALVLPEGNDITRSALQNLGLHHEARGRIEEATTAFLDLLEFDRRFSGDEHPRTLETGRNLATLRMK